MPKNDFDLFLAVKETNCSDSDEARIDLWHRLLDAYIKFKIDIPKHVEGSSPEIFLK